MSDWLSENLKAVEEAFKNFSSSLLSHETTIQQFRFDLTERKFRERLLDGIQLQDELNLSRLANTLHWARNTNWPCSMMIPHIISGTFCTRIVPFY